MSLMGVEVSIEALDKIEPNTVLVVISDAQGKVKVIKTNPSSMAEGDAFLRVAASQGQSQSGCWVFINGMPVWKDPCPN